MGSGKGEQRRAQARVVAELGPGVPMVNKHGDKSWFVDGKLHRADGPAIEYANGSRAWFVGGERHRLDGPAIEFMGGGKQWWLDGEQVTEDEVKRAAALERVVAYKPDAQQVKF